MAPPHQKIDHEGPNFSATTLQRFPRHFWTNMDSIYQIKYNLSSQVVQNGKSNSEDVRVRFGLKRVGQSSQGFTLLNMAIWQMLSFPIRRELKNSTF
ncbi:unnamed protein product [Prunus armeniaca]